MSEGLSDFYKRLTKVQVELNAPKGQFNDFSKFYYRSGEDILEAVKPINLKYDLHLKLTDAIEIIGDRYYIKAIATITDILNPENTIEVTAYARESKIKKGMDESQITGTTSSYARKYALNGLYLTDDNKDPDTNEYVEEEQEAIKQGKKVINNTQVSSVKKVIDKIALLTDKDPADAAIGLLEHRNLPNKIEQLTNDQYGSFLIYLNDAYSKRLKIKEAADKEAADKLEREKEQPEQKQGSIMQGNTTAPVVDDVNNYNN